MSFTGKRRLAVLAVRRPREFLDRLRTRRELRHTDESSTLMPSHIDPFAAVHAVLYTGDCRSCEPEFREVWERVRARITGPSFHDADTVLAITLWVVTRHTRPTRVVETGVAQGVTSACILEAMGRNGVGHLWSIDLPPLDETWGGSTGVAVGQAERARWTYIRGSVDRRLGPLLEQLDTIDLYVHDALHTYRAMTNEFALAWPRLGAGSVLVSDDVLMNRAVEDFDFGDAALLVLADANKDGAVALAVKAGAREANAAVPGT